jgi:N-acetylglucosamine-6-sulfatase
MYLSHKAVHAMFEPAKRHEGMYEGEKIIYPPSYYLTAGDEYKEHLIPEWVKEQREQLAWSG